MRPRIVFVSAIAALIAALIASAERSSAQSPSATVVLPGFRGVVRMDTVGTPEVLRGEPAATFAALQLGLDSLGIEPTIREPALGYLGNLGLKVSRRMAGQPMSRWVDCGVGHTGPTANAYRVHLAILVSVAAEGEANSSVRVSVAAGAQSFSGPLGDPIACESTGALEQRILDIARRRLAAGAS